MKGDDTMPNWTYNRIICKKSIGDKILTKTNDEYFFDFNKLIPRPEDLKLDAGSIEHESIASYYLSRSDEEQSNIERLLKSKKVSFYHNYWEKYKNEIKYLKDNPDKLKYKRDSFNGLILSDFKKNFNNLNELGKQYLDNIEKHGYSQWYDWSVEKWGTKWNVEDDVNVSYDKSTDEYEITFNTAWSVPSGIVEEYSKLCSDEEFYWEYEDEDYDGTHILSKINGDIIDTIAPEYVNENDYIDV